MFQVSFVISNRRFDALLGLFLRATRSLLTLSYTLKFAVCTYGGGLRGRGGEEMEG